MTFTDYGIVKDQLDGIQYAMKEIEEATSDLNSASDIVVKGTTVICVLNYEKWKGHHDKIMNTISEVKDYLDTIITELNLWEE